mgnify:CR=1 FL=1
MRVRIHTTSDEQWEMASKVEADRIPFFTPGMIGCRTFIAVYMGEKVIGIASLTEETVWMENAIGVGYISTHVDHRNQGVSKLLVDAVFDYAKETKRGISNTRYEPDGELYLKPVIQRTALKYPSVKFVEREQLTR